MSLVKEPTPYPQRATSRRLHIGCWLFIGGSLLFTGEAIAELTDGLSLSAVIHLAEGLFFLIGSWCFLPTTEAKP